MTRLPTSSQIDFRVKERPKNVLGELVLYFVAIDSKHVLHMASCAPSSAHPPVASSGCIPLTLPMQLSIQSMINTIGDIHMMHSAEQELPLQSYPKCILNYSNTRRKWQGRKRTQHVATRAQSDFSHGPVGA